MCIYDLVATSNTHGSDTSEYTALCKDSAVFGIETSGGGIKKTHSTHSTDRVKSKEPMRWWSVPCF